MNEITSPLRIRMRRATVADLQDALRLLLDKRVLLADEGARRDASEGLQAERRAQTYGRATSHLVRAFQVERQLQASGEVDEATAAALNGLLAELGAFGSIAAFQVHGRIASRISASVGDLRVVVVDKSVGRDDMPLVETMTDSRGNYQASFSEAVLTPSGKEKPDLQARVFSGDRFLGASEVRYDASTQETINVVLDDQRSSALRSEYETLTAALTVHYQGRLGGLKETDQRQDITYLANKSGWDARAVALAAVADQFTAGTEELGAEVVIDPVFFYALFRAGLPANETAIYRTDPKTVEMVWQRASQQGVIPAELQDRVPATLVRFRRLATKRLVEGPALAGVSSFRELVALALGDDVRQQEQFADLYTLHGGNPPVFWEAVQGAFGEAAAKRLRLDGRLAYLTLNNAPLIGKLHRAFGQEGFTDTRQLVGAGFSRAPRWREVIGDVPVPPEIPGKDDAEKRQGYAQLMAAQLRLSFPTLAVAEMVKTGETPLVSAEARNGVYAFLAEHEGDFDIGMQPVGQYMARQGVELVPEVSREITRLQRVYQITPDDDAMNGLLREGVDSAYAVMGYEREAFVNTFRDAVGGEQNARMVHVKAQQVHAAVLNVATTFLTARGAAGIGAHSRPLLVDPAPSPPAYAADVVAYATMESLFGEMDYCTCEHCRSVLSPAAYLVDLLHFIDLPPGQQHAGLTNPLSVLLDRRPDIQHLPLTCENTNTPVPYVDLVNETLEHYITHGLSLAGYEGHNTDGSVEAGELLASPQFVSDEAYKALAGENFPHPLPFHQPLETLRRYFARFGAPLDEVMEALRGDDRLERAGRDDYGWRDIWMEVLGLSRAGHRLLTERWLTGGTTDVMLTVKNLYGFASTTADADVLDELSKAELFCRRVEITYEELAAVLRTGFVNPNAHLIPRLERLGVSFATLKVFKYGVLSDAEFAALLAPGLDPSHYGGDIKSWVRNDDNYSRIMSLITLTNPQHPDEVCNFEEVELRYSDPIDPDGVATANRLRGFEFIRLIRFIRLWKKLGWSIEQTGKAVTALYPAALAPDDPSDAVNVERLDAGFLELLPRLAVIRRVVDVLQLAPDKDLLPLLACVARIDTHGDSSLYRQMFLGPSQADDAFSEDGYGNFLTDAIEALRHHPEIRRVAEPLLDHAATLRAAFSLTATEFDQITDALGYDATTLLTVDNISAVFRRGWLARKLRLSVRELLLLTQLTGYDPFETPNPVGPALLRFIEFIARLRALEVKPVQALYLIWNQDLSGKSAPPETETTALARTLRSSLAAIEAEFVLVDDPDGSITRSRMALAYGNQATDLFFGLLENTYVTAVPYDHSQATLEQPILDAAAGAIAYDDFRKRLSYTGVFTTATDVKAIGGVIGLGAAFADAIDRLYSENQAVVGPFFARYPELLKAHDAYVASPKPSDEKRSALLQALLPELIGRRKRQQALQSVSAAADADAGLAGVLLGGGALLHAAGDPHRPSADDITAVERAGLTVQYFYAATATGEPDLTPDTEAGLQCAPPGPRTPPSLPANAATPGARISGVWSGYLEAPENGVYKLRIDTDATAAVTLSLGDGVIPLAPDGAGSWTNTAPIELRAGALCPFVLTVENVRDALAVRWETAGRGVEVIPTRYLYPKKRIDNLRQAYVRVLKAVALAAAFRLTAAETVHLAAHPDYQIGGEGWLNHLPVTGNPDGATTVRLFKVLAGLLDFARIKADISAGDERLLQVLRAPQPAAAGPESLLFALTRWDQGFLHALLDRFGKTGADLAHVATLRRVYDAARLVKKLGIPAPVLIKAANNEPTAATVRELQAALKARYDQSAWLGVLRPINDEMRSLQRDALIAYILHRMRSHKESKHIDTADKLFEYFLMDVQMDPCMLTSRIRHALSSVQLFIERCLMNLEERVSPASINASWATQWQWRKRYRVWEANRRVFLHPENWLEPELRDRQSPEFKEVMSELLQGDITDDRAAEALLSYLAKLEEVAKLTVTAIHVETKPGAEPVTHVVARTAGENRKYFYRRHDPPEWTPWEKIPLNIEDDPVLPVVWNDRLFLFWLKLVTKTGQDLQLPTTTAKTLDEVNPGDAFPKTQPQLDINAILNWSEYRAGKWQPARASGPARPLRLDTTGIDSINRSHLALRAQIEKNGPLQIIVTLRYKDKACSFVLYNAFSTPDRRPQEQYPGPPERVIYTSGGLLSAMWLDEPRHNFTMVHSLLRNTIEHGVVQDLDFDEVVQDLDFEGNSWDAPFFYQDAQHVFNVTTKRHAVSVLHWDGFLVEAKTPMVVPDLPHLVVESAKDLPQPAQPSGPLPGFGVIDPIPVEHVISEDGYIHAAIGTAGTVQFGDLEIGPWGSHNPAAPVR